MKKKRNGIKLILKKDQYNDPKMQELISKSNGVNIISDEDLEGLLEKMVPFEDEDEKVEVFKL